ncbi:hypothetical protein ALQ25_200283 [Pseudomonas coronafaciens pv. atropurpurea]|nr:hypothetical protein ALQ25_200283 [Pseudomonas coronafaciens pv. atropurpurea]
MGQELGRHINNRDKLGLLLDGGVLVVLVGPKPTPYSVIQMNLIGKEHHNGSD